MEIKKICEDFEFLMNPLKFLEDLIEKINFGNKKMLVWSDQHKIFSGLPDYFESRWRLIFNICFSNNKQDFQKRENFVSLHGKTHVGKFFFYPIWVEVLKNSGLINIVQIGKKSEIKQKRIKISDLTSEIFIGFLGDFAKNRPEKIGDCYCEGILPEISEKDRPRLLEAMSTIGFSPNGFTRKTPVWTVGAGK